MKPLKIVLSVGHMGKPATDDKPNNPLDRGAEFTREAIPGKRSFRSINESDACLEYAFEAYQLLTAIGHHPFLLTHDFYNKRAEFSNRISADLYLACHLNSSSKPPENPYALVEIAHNAGDITKKFARHLADMFPGALPVKTAKVKQLNKRDRGFVCIEHVRAPALLIEPLFGNTKDGFNQIDKFPDLIGSIIATAIGSFDWEGNL
jgi:N-acetylmuramoyl-L-alanine amidase